MNKLLLTVISLMLILWLSLGSWWYAKNYGDLGNTLGLTLSIDGFEYPAKETFYFYHSSPDPIIPKSTEEAFQYLADYMVSNPNKQLKIWGHHSTSESNSQLGKARAESIKLELVNIGAPENQIATKGISLSSAQSVNGQIYGGVVFRLEDINKKPSKPASNGTTSHSFESPVAQLFYDKNGFESAIVKDLDKDFIKKAKLILRKNADAQLYIVGHTNGVGDAEKNEVLAKQQTKSIKKYLISRGFNPTRLTKDFKGNAEPIGNKNNQTDIESSRRVEVFILE